MRSDFNLELPPSPSCTHEIGVQFRALTAVLSSLFGLCISLMNKILHYCDDVMCLSQPETADHLFFLCPYSQQVWQLTMANMLGTLPQTGNSLISHVLQNSKSHLASSKGFKLLLSAVAYYIWLERNYMKYKSTALPATALAQVIRSTLF